MHEIEWEHDSTFDDYSAKFGGPMGKWVVVWREKQGQWLVRAPTETIGSRVHGPFSTLKVAKEASSEIMAKLGYE